MKRFWRAVKWSLGLMGSIVVGILEVWMLMGMIGLIGGTRSSWQGPKPRW